MDIPDLKRTLSLYKHSANVLIQDGVHSKVSEMQGYDQWWGSNFLSAGCTSYIFSVIFSAGYTRITNLYFQPVLFQLQQ